MGPSTSHPTGPCPKSGYFGIFYNPLLGDLVSAPSLLVAEPQRPQPQNLQVSVSTMRTRPNLGCFFLSGARCALRTGCGVAAPLEFSPLGELWDVPSWKNPPGAPNPTPDPAQDIPKSQNPDKPSRSFWGLGPFPVLCPTALWGMNFRGLHPKSLLEQLQPFLDPDPWNSRHFPSLSSSPKFPFGAPLTVHPLVASPNSVPTSPEGTQGSIPVPDP